MRDHDHAQAERLIAAMRALSDTELLAVCQPFADIAELIAADGTFNRGASLATVLRIERGNPRAIEFLEAVGHWIFAELHHRDQILEDLEGGETG